jgi:drug/metabolite transporter (DMT)-like permease
VNAFLAVVAMLGVSASGPLMAGTAAPALAIAFWRNAAGSLVLAPLALRNNRAEMRQQSRRGWIMTVFAGAMLAAHFATWVSALKLTSVAAATALVTTQVVWVVLIDRLRGMRTSRAVLFGMGLAVAGVLVISGVDLTLSSRALAGDALAVAGGLFAALYLMAGSEVRESWSTTSYTFTCYGICALLLGIVALVARVDLAGFSVKAWLLMAAVTVCAQLLGHSLLNHLLAVMTPGVISLLLLFEVPGAALLAGIFLGQTPPAGVYAGLALILTGLVVVVVRRPPPDAILAD